LGQSNRDEGVFAGRPDGPGLAVALQKAGPGFFENAKDLVVAGVKLFCYPLCR
jgi:hypothetical protein